MSKQKKIAIIGVGLIGGSIAMGLKKRLGHNVSIIGACSSPKRALQAQKLHIIDEVLNNLKRVPGDTRLVILATPISDTLTILPTLPKNLLIMDVCSIKNPLYKALKNGQKFIGTHPMAGSEHGGFESSDPDLFSKKPWIICQGINTTKTHLQIVKDLITLLGAKIVSTDSLTHDELTSLSSHLPFLVSSALMSTALHAKNWSQAQKIASTGFRDSTRLASSNTNLRIALAMFNRNSLLKDLSHFEKEVVTLKKFIRKNDKQKLETYFANTKKERDKWIQQ